MKSKIAYSAQVVFDISIEDWDACEEMGFPEAIKMQDTTATFTFYPNGDDKSADGYTAGYITISDESNLSFVNDRRFASLVFKCGDNVSDLVAKPIRTFINGWGSSNLFPKQHVQKYGEITVCIRLDDGHDCQNLLESAYKESTRTLYDLVQKSGDIELIPIVNGKSSSGKDENDSIGSDEICGMDRAESVLSIKSIDDDDEKEMDSMDSLLETRNCSEPRKYRMSSILLSNASTVFQRMLANDMKESTEKRIRIPCANPMTIEDLSYFIVTGRLSADADAFDLVKVAHLYQMDSLIWACLERLIHGITADNFVRVVTVFEEYNMAKDDVVKNMYGKLLHYYHEHKNDSLKTVAKSHSLPFCFTQWSEYMDHTLQYHSKVEESDPDESEVDETELQEMFIAMEEID